MARALANLTYDEAFAGQAVAEGALPPLVAMLRRDDNPALQEGPTEPEPEPEAEPEP